MFAALSARFRAVSDRVYDRAMDVARIDAAGFDNLRFAPDGSVLAAGAGAGGVLRLALPADASGSIASGVPIDLRCTRI